MTFSQRIKDRNKDEAKPKAQVSITPAGQPVYPQYTTAGSGSLGVPSQELPDDCAKIMPTDWIVVDYSILEDKPIRWVVDDETFKRYFKLAMSG
jgi:hypothetical protein